MSAGTSSRRGKLRKPRPCGAAVDAARRLRHCRQMTRYQIKIVNGDLTDMVVEIATQTAAHVISLAGPAVRDLAVYPPIAAAVKTVLHRYVRGFHVCGCTRHCDEGSEPTELRDPRNPAPAVDQAVLRTTRVRRYVLNLEIPLSAFARELEVEVMRAVAHSLPDVRNWHGLLFPVIRQTIEPIVGKYVYYTPTCNQGQYICEIGACTEFDPWHRV